MPNPAKTVKAHVYNFEDSTHQFQEVTVPVETAVLIDVQEVGQYKVMASPDHLEAMAAGLLRVERVIQGADDILSIKQELDPLRVEIKLKPEVRDRAIGEQTKEIGPVTVTTSGYRMKSPSDPPQVARNVRIKLDAAYAAHQEMVASQALRDATRGTHAAALFDTLGKIVSFAEDVGRHNALDKAIGGCLLRGDDPSRHAIALSSRVSLEMLLKCASAGLEIIAAVSAPTSLALEKADQLGLTVCASLKGKLVTIFTHPERVIDSTT